MKRFLILFAVLCAIVAPLSAQGLTHDYIVAYTASAATSNVITIQQPAADARVTSFLWVYVECDVDCTATIERDGTAATATAVTPSKLNTANVRGDSIPAASATAYRSSDVGVGTVLGPAGGYSIVAGDWRVIDMRGKVLAGTGTGKNLSVRIESASAGVLTGVMKWHEY